MKGILVLLTAALLTIVPPVTADGDGCKDEASASAGGLHVHSDGGAVELWSESNNIPGLQRGGCTDINGRDRPGDTRLL